MGVTLTVPYHVCVLSDGRARVGTMCAHHTHHTRTRALSRCPTPIPVAIRIPVAIPAAIPAAIPRRYRVSTASRCQKRKRASSLECRKRGAWSSSAACVALERLLTACPSGSSSVTRPAAPSPPMAPREA
eukprot:2673657-Prymnesium_polylepis.2